MRRFAGELGFLVLVGFSIVGAVALRAIGAIEDAKDAIVRR